MFSPLLCFTERCAFSSQVEMDQVFRAFAIEILHNKKNTQKSEEHFKLKIPTIYMI